MTLPLMSTRPGAESPLSDALRLELRREQMALESAPLVAVLTDPRLTIPIYADSLIGWWRVVSVLQPVTDVALDRTSPEKRWLESDLGDLGRVAKRRRAIAPLVTSAEALGYRYVIESQHIHSRLIAPTVRSVLGDRVNAFRFYTAHDGGTHTWRSTMSDIDAVPCDDRRSVLVGARAALAALHRSLGGC